jgi:HK97 family phage major capsid protein
MIDQVRNRRFQADANAALARGDHAAAKRITDEWTSWLDAVDAPTERERLIDPTPLVIRNGGNLIANREALNEYLRTGVIGRELRDHVDAEGFIATGVNPERRALSVTADTAGGFTVVPDLRRGEHDTLAQSALRRAGAAERVTVSDTYQEVRLYGDNGEWLPESPDGTPSANPTIEIFNATLKKRGFLHLITEQHRQDSNIDLAAMVVENAIDSCMAAEDAGLTNGTDGGNEPPGFLNSSELPATTDISGTTADQISNTAADAGSAPKIVNLAGTLPSRFHDGAVWMMHGSSWAAVRSLVRADGAPYFPETFQGFTLAGYPVILNDAVPEDGTNGNKVIVFGNFRKGFRIVNKPEGIAIRLLLERWADRDLVGIRIRYRVGGGMYLPDAFRVGTV